MFYVYCLHLEGDDEIRYVGSTCNPQSRLWAHLRDTEKGTPKDLWVKENCARVRMKILATAAECNRRTGERWNKAPFWNASVKVIGFSMSVARRVSAQASKM